MYNAGPAPYASRSPPMAPYPGSPGPMSAHAHFSASSSSLASPPVPANGFSPMPSGQSARYAMGSQQVNYARNNPPRYGTPPGMAPGSFPQHPQQPNQLPPAKHKGTLAPGQMITVGTSQVRIERYLSEGGYAHVYLTSSERPIYPPLKEDKKGRWGEKGYTRHCLKRIAFQDEAVWTDVKKEIEVMKSLPPNPHLTQYLGSAHSRLPNGGYEVFILMEFCAGGGIIDLLNKRLRDRLKEIEILNIFADVCEAVAAMHALPRPLLHRDLKIENVLSQPTGSQSSSRPMGLIFKLCDFGSTTFPASRPPASKIEADALALDLNKNTTLQYRSPEMVEPMLGQAVGLPSDIWALGVLLYKLCYYTTPFEEHGTLAIVNAKYSFPQYPVYSPRIQHLIASMLVEHPQRRPTVFEVLTTAHEMSGTKPLVDYPIRSRSLSAASPPPQRPAHSSQPSNNLLDFTSSTPPPSAPSIQPNLASSIQPQRRGRPGRDTPGPAAAMPKPPHFSPPLTASQPPSLKIQVTGDTGQKPTEKPPASATSSIDAFGAPSKAPPVKASSGFSESFSGRKPFVPTSKFGEQLQKEYSGFGDSFGDRKTASASKSSKASPISRSEDSFTSAPKTTSPPPLQEPEHSAVDPDHIGEVSFETRFPSLETLDADHPTEVISPRPGLRSQPSMIGNLTGGDLSTPKEPVVRQDGLPQPRSTHVTGTVFKPTESMSVGARKNLLEQGTVPRPVDVQPPDLLTGEEDSMGEPLVSKVGVPRESVGPGAEVEARSSTMSSDEGGPEDAEASYKPIASPTDKQPEPKGPPRAGPPATAKPANLRHYSSKTRPQSMYAAPQKPTSEADSEAKSETKASGRPTHGRTGSVTSVTSRFEQMQTEPKSPGAAASKKPSIAVKPATLRKPSMEVSPKIVETEPVRTEAPPKVVKPEALRRSSKFGDAPVPAGFGRSSSGRSFPIHRTENGAAPGAAPDAAREKEESPQEERQSVNSLIARWNQGEVAKKAPKRGLA